MNEVHESLVNKVIQRHFGVLPEKVFRMTVGSGSEVYTAVLADREIIVRLNSEAKILTGTSINTPVFKSLGIIVPEILAEDFSKTLIPYAYQIQQKIPGKDIGEVIQTLSPEQLKLIAKEISNIINKVKTIPTNGKFGGVGGGENELSDTWTERVRLMVEESVERGRKTGIMDDEIQALAEKLYKDNINYFDLVKPIAYFGDMSSKNVMVYNGEFSGLIDLDAYTQGDFLEGISRIKASWFGTPYGEIYTNAVMDEQNLTAGQRKMVNVYAILNRISWACENGIQFNQNTTAVINREREKEDKEVIKNLATLI
jgi:hypothetical protein